MVDGTIDSSSFRGTIKIDGYSADGQILLKRVANLSGCNQQITLPMTGNGTIFDFRRSFADRNSIDDPALGVPVNAGMPRAAYTPLGAKVLNQLFFQRSAGLNEQAAIDRFVRHAQALILGILPVEPTGNLLG